MPQGAARGADSSPARAQRRLRNTPATRFLHFFTMSRRPTDGECITGRPRDMACRQRGRLVDPKTSLECNDRTALLMNMHLERRQERRLLFGRPSEPWEPVRHLCTATCALHLRAAGATPYHQIWTGRTSSSTILIYSAVHATPPSVAQLAFLSPLIQLSQAPSHRRGKQHLWCVCQDVQTQRCMCRTESART